MRSRRRIGMLAIVLGCAAWTGPALALDEKLPESETLMRALADELNRSLKLQMEDLEKPYFIQFDVDDSLNYQISAAYGAITAADRDRTRTFHTRIRVGSAELDNTNFAEGGGGVQSALPVDDDYAAIRQAIWRAADADYKRAVETLTRKRAYMKDKNIADRAPDFSPAPPVEQREPGAVLRFDEAKWQEQLQRISAHFKQYPQVQDSNVRLIAGAGNSYVVNTDGARLRTGDTYALLFLTAQVQAADGMRLSGSRSYVANSAAELPPIERIQKDIDALVADLTAVMPAATIEQYSGPVLFDAPAAAQVFRTFLAGGLAGRPDPVGEQRRGAAGNESLETKLGTRILPKTFQVWDDPTAKTSNNEMLLGHYRYDDEGTPAARVELVKDGKLEALCLSRAPTKKLAGTNGHGRRAGGSPEAAIGCLFVQDKAGVSDAELKAALLAAAKDAGLEFGVRIKSLRSADFTSTRSDLVSMMRRGQRGGGGPTLGDPVIAYKVYVADGREEPFRGCEFGTIDVTSLKKIVAAGDTPQVFNYMGSGMGGATPPASIVAPAVLFEELELSKIQQEYDKPPLVPAPLSR